MDFWAKLRNFLNKECIWIANKGSNELCKIYTSSTAASPRFKSLEGDVTVFNTTVIILKPKKRPHYITVYINEKLAACCSPEAVFVKAVPGRYGFYLIYFGPFNPPSEDVKIPNEAVVLSQQDVVPSFSDILDMSKNVTGSSVSAVLGPEYKTVGRCVFLNGVNICQFVVSPDFYPLLPHFDAFPSLGRILNLITRCEDRDCVACFGYGIHANVYNGHTRRASEGSDAICPCVCSCTAVRRGTDAEVTGNRGLLALLFSPDRHQTVVALRFRDSPEQILGIGDLLCGVDVEGREVECSAEIWILLQHSQFLSRVQTYCCQILKRMVL